MEAIPEANTQEVNWATLNTIHTHSFSNFNSSSSKKEGSGAMVEVVALQQPKTATMVAEILEEL
jgi:hypothetical protein